VDKERIHSKQQSLRGLCCAMFIRCGKEAHSKLLDRFADAEPAARGLSATFRSPSEALAASTEILLKLAPECSIGLSTLDVTDEHASRRLREEAEGLAEMAEPGQILLSLATVELVRGNVGSELQLDELGTHQVGAYDTLVRVYGFEPGGTAMRPKGLISERPWHASRFVGREREIDLFSELIETNRLISIIGPVGIGKSRFASRVRTEFEDLFRDGCVWIDLRLVTRRPVLYHRIGAAFEINSLQERTLVEHLARKIGDSELLVVLDGVEDVRTEVAALCERLLADCLNIAIVVTGIKRLGVEGEHPIVLPGLGGAASFESPEQIAQYPATQCFMGVATAVDTEFKLDHTTAPWVARICEEVDGVPWALILAASKVAVLTPRQILTRLKDNPYHFLKSSGTQTGSDKALASVIAQLTPWARTLLAGCSLFRGPFDLRSLESCFEGVGEIPPGSVFASLQELVDSHLVSPLRSVTHTRAYYLAPLLKEFATQLRRTLFAPQVEARYEAFVALEIERLQQGGSGRTAEDLEQTDLVYEDARNVWLKRLTGKGVPEEMYFQVGGMLDYWSARGYFNDGLELALTAQEGKPPAKSSCYGRLLNAGSWCAMRLGDFEQSRRLVKQAIRRAITCRDNLRLASGLATAAAIAYETERPRMAARCYRRSIMLVHTPSIKNSHSYMFANLGAVLTDLRRFEEARNCFSTCERAHDEMGWPRVGLLSNQAHFYLRTGDLDECRRHLIRACDEYEHFPEAPLLHTLYMTGINYLVCLGRIDEASEMEATRKALMSQYSLLLTPRQASSVQRLGASLLGTESLVMFDLQMTGPLGPLMECLKTGN
jgi:predicted ATPase